MDVGFWQAGSVRDALHAGTLEAVTGELLFGRTDNKLFVLLPNATDGFVCVVCIHFKLHACELL
jgi:hypothetical protein